METIFRWSGNHPLKALGLALLVTAAFASGLPFVRIDASMEHLLSEEDPEVKYLNDVRENFGERPLMLLMVRSGTLSDPATLRSVKAIGDRVAELDGVEQVSSLFNLHLPVLVRGEIREGPALGEIPANPGELAERLGELRHHRIVSDHFLNKAGNALIFIILLERETSEGENHTAIVGALTELRDRFQKDLEGSAELTLLGVPLVKTTAERFILRDLIYLGPVALLVIGGIIFLFFRSFAAVFLPLVTGSLSVIATLGFMGWADFEISVFLSTIVVLLLVVGCTEDLHILSDYMDHLDLGMERLEAIAGVGKSLGRALILTVSTTVLSFVSIAFTDFVGLQHFAISCAFGMTVNFLITILVLPAVLALLPALRRSATRSKAGLLLRLETLFVGLLRSGKRTSITLLALVLGVSGLGISKLEVNTDYLRFFSEDSELVQSYRRFVAAFDGASYLTVTMETGQHDGVNQSGNLMKLYQLHGFLDRECGHALGYVDLLNEFRAARDPALTDFSTLPSTEEIAHFRKGVPLEVLKPFLDHDASRSAIRLRVGAPTSTDVLNLESRILEYARDNLGDGVEVRVAGDRIVIARLCDLVTTRLFYNLFSLSLVVALMISASVRSFTLGFLAIIPNLFPVIVTLGAMGWLGIPMSVGTFPVTIVAFGVTVDDTIHLLARHHLERKKGGSVEDAAARGLVRELRPVIATSVIVASGYLVMTLSPFRVNAEVGLLFAIAMISGLIADLILTPVLLSRFGSRSQSYGRSTSPEQSLESS